eukprot:COSAG03_NODE_14825_length_450_cov_8.974359_1_plen_56_part_01
MNPWDIGSHDSVRIAVPGVSQDALRTEKHSLRTERWGALVTVAVPRKRGCGPGGSW